MARELIAESRKDNEADTPAKLHGAAANVALGLIMERWSAGMGVAPGSYVENVHVHEAGELVGFRLYLVQGEVRSYGPARVETVDPS